MKRLILAVASASLLLTTFAYCASSTGSQEISARIEPAIALTAPAALNMGTLTLAGYESGNQGILVKSNAEYTIYIKANYAKLKEWCPGSPTCTCGASAGYVTGGAEFQLPLQWKEASGTYADISTTDAVVKSGLAPTPNAGVTTNVVFKQSIDYGDKYLTYPQHVYKIVVTYTAIQNL